MNPIEYESKNAVGKQKISSKYHQLVEKCNSLHVSISCVVQLIDLFVSFCDVLFRKHIVYLIY